MRQLGKPTHAPSRASHRIPCALTRETSNLELESDSAHGRDDLNPRSGLWNVQTSDVAGGEANTVVESLLGMDGNLIGDNEEMER